jgi:hypothetical protein
MVRTRNVKPIFKCLLLALATFLTLKFMSGNSLGIEELELLADKKIDWHDHDFINYEENRSGPGERSGYVLTNPEEIKLNEDLSKTYGLSMVVSDKVSVNRSLIDPRRER